MKDAMIQDNKNRAASPAALFAAALILCAAFSGCKPPKTVEFCEGVSPKGEGMKCGTVFTTGELTAIVKAEKAFGVDSLNLKVYALEAKSTEPVESLLVKVKPEEKTAPVNLPLYNEGKYRVRVTTAEGNTVAEGELEVVDTY